LAKIGWAARGGGRGIGTVAWLPRPGGSRAGDGAPRHPCATCGACCRTYIVPLCGRDVWRIGGALHLRPERFVVAWREEDDGPDRFRLEPDGPLYTLVLDRRVWSGERSRCVFLLELPGGHDRCGIYEHRPAACGAYPMVLRREAVALRDDPLCPEGAWRPDEPARPAWREALHRARMDFDVYHAVVERWNARGRADGSRHHPSDYFDYLLRVYAGLDALERSLGEQALADLRAGWRAPLGADGPAAWQRHLERVRDVAAGA
jgi:Fe-S-cluster containining protein